MADRTALLELVPDLPRWVEARGMLLAGAAALPAGAGYLVVEPVEPLLAVIGDPDAGAVLGCAAGYPGATILCALERTDLVRELAGRGWAVERATLLTLPDPATLPDDSGAGPLPPAADLSHLPAPLADEVARAARTRAVQTIQVDGVPVSFAYAPWRTARWFDVAVDTAPAARQLGLATRVAAALIRAERAGGREPVWGAADSNAASLRLADRLGFVATDALWLARAG